MKIDFKNWIQLLPEECSVLNSIFVKKEIKNNNCNKKTDNNKNNNDVIKESINKRKHDDCYNENDTKKYRDGDHNKENNNSNKYNISSLDIDKCIISLKKIKLPPKYMNIIDMHRSDDDSIRNISPSSIVELENSLGPSHGA